MTSRSRRQGPRAALNPAMLDTFQIDPGKVRDLAPEVLDATGRLRILPAEYWAGTTREDRAVFGNRYGIYNFPTVELVEYLRGVIGDGVAIEIGAGNGVLSEELGIVATDSKVQDAESHRELYADLGFATVSYGPNVQEFHATKAVRRFRPDVVIACWVYHKYSMSRASAGGHAQGVDEEEVLRGCGSYVFVGNQHVHRHKKIWDLPHTIEFPPFVYSRAYNGTPNFIATWQGRKRTRT